MSNSQFVPLGQLLSSVKGGGTPEREVADYWNGAIPWATVKDFREGVHVLERTQERITEQGLKNSASKLIPPHTPIICTRMAVGRVAMADFAVAINQDLKALFPKPGVDESYLLRALESVKPEIEAVAIGSTVKGIGLDQLRLLEVFFPDTEGEQKKIAEVLSTLDRAIEQTEALIAKQQRIKTGLMQDLLTKGVDAHGNIRSEATHAFKDSPLGRVPVEWDVQQLSAVAKQLTSGSRGWARYYSSEGTIFLRIGNLTREHINLHLDDLVFVQVPESSEGKRTSVCKGDLLISITADLGIIGVIPTDLDEAYVSVCPKTPFSPPTCLILNHLEQNSADRFRQKHVHL